MNVRHTLGILTCQERPPYAEHPFFRQIARRAAACGLNVIVFTPWSWLPAQKRVYGYVWREEKKRWVPASSPLPDLVYDRCFFTSPAHYRSVAPYLKRLQRLPSVRFLGHGLAGKWEVYTILHRHPDIRPYLPETARVHGVGDVLAHLGQKGDVVIKPLGGSLGRKVVRILHGPADTFHLFGRDAWNRPFAVNIRKGQLIRWLGGQLAGSRWVIQPYLHLYTEDRRPFDIRVLVQKTGQGEWETVGKAVRQGQTGGLTSNLHGGGKGIGFHSFMQRHFPDKADEIERQIDELSRKIPPLLEGDHGPLVELGIDIGVDREGKVWLIEVNSKPGRQLFAQTGEIEVQYRSVQNIIDYACHLLQAKDRKVREKHRHEHFSFARHHLEAGRTKHLVARRTHGHASAFPRTNRHRSFRPTEEPGQIVALSPPPPSLRRA